MFIPSGFQSILFNLPTKPYLQVFAVLQIGNPPQSSYWLENLEGSIFAWLVGCSVVRHGRDSSDVTLALEDAQVVRWSVGRY